MRFTLLNFLASTVFSLFSFWETHLLCIFFYYLTRLRSGIVLNELQLVLFIHRHECFTGKYITRKISTKPYPGLERRIF